MYRVTYDDPKLNFKQCDFKTKEEAIQYATSLKECADIQIFQRIGIIESTPYFVPDESQEDGDGWIEWHGVASPVSGRVEYKLRDGYKGLADACRLRWDQSGSGTDIIAYRIVK